MNPSPSPATQGFATDARERLAAPAPMDEAQRAAADALIAGPRKGVYGPFKPLLHVPALLDRVGALGEALRFQGRLEARLRELVICAVARHTSNQFEWLMHAPLAVKAGVGEATIAALRDGRTARELPADEALALDFAHELLQHHGVADATYAHARAAFGEAGVLELSTLIGYFAMVCWTMNVARTPGTGDGAPLTAFPS